MLRTFLLASALAAVASPAFAQQQQQAPPAVETMSRQQLRDEVARLRPYVANGGVSPFRPAGCTAAENRQFDFWLGQWDVSPTNAQNGMAVGTNTITLLDQGCVIMEDWRPFTGATGHSLNIYDPRDQKWHQTWVDANGLRTEYAGVFTDGAMYLDNMTGGVPQNAPAGTRVRMNYRALNADTVRQWGERFDPATNAWTVTWDLTYRRLPGSGG